MLYQLRNLSESEQSIVLKSPVWVILLVACADHDIDEKEIDRAKEIVHIKTYATKNDVKNIYKELDAHLDEEIDAALKSLSAQGRDRLIYLEENLAKLNKIFPKLDPTYASQLYGSLRSLALSIAQAEGGFFGVGRINGDEEKYLSLPMLERP
ncbi:MAG: hypothetical protein RLZZ337_1694 [Bacteroidota bacterium]|jgi:hypothetical protein